MGYYVLDDTKFWIDNNTAHSLGYTSGGWTDKPVEMASISPRDWLNHDIFVRSKEYIRARLEWRIIKAEHLGVILAEHAITNKSKIEIIDKHDYDLWSEP